MCNRNKLICDNNLIFEHLFFYAYRFAQIVYQKVCLIVSSDRPYIVFNCGNVFQVHTGVRKRFPLVVERGQRENPTVVVDGQQALLLVVHYNCSSANAKGIGLKYG